MIQDEYEREHDRETRDETRREQDAETAFDLAIWKSLQEPEISVDTEKPKS
jgi:hypothetical protein